MFLVINTRNFEIRSGNFKVGNEKSKLDEKFKIGNEKFGTGNGKLVIGPCMHILTVYYKPRWGIFGWECIKSEVLTFRV